MERLTIERSFVSDPFPDGNRVVTLKTAEKGDVKFTVYSGKENPFQNWQEVNGRQIFCDLTQKGYIDKGKFQWADNVSQPSSETPYSAGTSTQSALQQNGRSRSNNNDPKQQSIERQACMKTAAELFDTCLSNGMLNPSMDQSEITDWIDVVAGQLYSKCLG
jgi:hypothetical protein